LVGLFYFPPLLEKKAIFKFMEIKKVKQILEDMLELCGQLGDENLSNRCGGIYNDAQAAKDPQDIISLSNELMIFVGEAPWSNYDMEDVKDEIEGVFNKMMEEFEDF